MSPRRVHLARAAAGWTALAGLACVALGATGACDDTSSHIFVGRQYDPVVGCFGEDLSIDVVAGPEPETPCAPICITSTFDEAGTLEVYVSSMCAPFPNYPWVLVPDAGGSPVCQAALAAWALDTTCEDGGIVINRPDAAADATSD